MRLGNTPFLAAHVDGDTAWLDLLFVPAPLRHHGLGRQLFERWLGGLPPDVRTIHLLAAALDGDSPLGFWRRMGFSVEEADFPELFDGSYMVRAVAGLAPIAHAHPLAS